MISFIKFNSQQNLIFLPNEPDRFLHWPPIFWLKMDISRRLFHRQRRLSKWETQMSNHWSLDSHRERSSPNRYAAIAPPHRTTFPVTSDSLEISNHCRACRWPSRSAENPPKMVVQPPPLLAFCSTTVQPWISVNSINSFAI